MCQVAVRQLILPTEKDVEAVNASFTQTGYDLRNLFGEPLMDRPLGIRGVVVAAANTQNTS